MARVTVEDCLEHVENRFKLVLLASKRSRQLVLGAEPLVPWENDKPTVVALREIAENLVNEETMEKSLAAPAEGEGSEFGEDELAALYSEISRELSQNMPEDSSKPDAAPATEKQPGSFFFSKDFTRSSEAGPADVPAEQPAQVPDADSSPPSPETDSSSEGEQGF